MAATPASRLIRKESELSKKSVGDSHGWVAAVIAAPACAIRPSSAAGSKTLVPPISA